MLRWGAIASTSAISCGRPAARLFLSSAARPITGIVRPSKVKYTFSATASSKVMPSARHLRRCRLPQLRGRFTPYPAAIPCRRRGRQLLEALLAQSPHDRTALDKAVWRQHPRVVKLLLAQRGIRVNVLNGDGQTPLTIAREKGDPTIVRMLEDARATTRGALSPSLAYR